MSKIAEIFKAYDVRGIYPDQFNGQIAERLGLAYAAVKKPKKLAVGGDVRTSTAELKQALIKGLVAGGVEVVDIGTVTTDQLYFAVGQYGFDGGISVTASHNPGQYNGLKFAEYGAAPITTAGLLALCDWATSPKQLPAVGEGQVSNQEILDDYIKHVLAYIDLASVKAFKVVANANFGAVGRSVDKIGEKLNLKLERLNWQEDGSFPKGPPNPLLPENRDETIDLIKKTSPELGVAWDADADRVFFFTGEGEFIHSCYIIALLAPEFLRRFPGAKIIHDIATSWVIDRAVEQAGGTSITNRTGHTFIKARMRQEDAPFAGESSGHYYFRDSFYADNGIAPFLMILQIMTKTGKSLKQLVDPLMEQYKVSGEINFKVKYPQKKMAALEKQFGKEGEVNKMDGLVVESKDWRFSARVSNTEPLMRLNAEATSADKLNDIVAKLTKVINSN